MTKRAIVIVLDSVGIGEMPDSASFGDTASHTLGNIYKSRGYLNLPNLYALGLANIQNSMLPTSAALPLAAYGKAMEATPAKDTTSGHWEMCGIIMENAFQVFPNGFPQTFIDKFEHLVHRKTLGNVAASGTEIIMQLGDEHVKTGMPIVYTSADSVFQIAAHEEIIPLMELYSMCQTARDLLNDEYFVGRVIARPFVGTSGNYVRTPNRRDYAVPPIKPTILDGLVMRNHETIAVGKIEDIFAHRGISISNHTKNNSAGIDATIKYIKDGCGSFIFTNLVDFDMLYGHRNDVEGYAAALEAFDARLPELLSVLSKEDLLIITADHGCDPTTKSTDHSREYIPVLAYGSMVKPVNIGVRKSFADIGATVFEYITGERWSSGESFLNDILK